MASFWTPERIEDVLKHIASGQSAASWCKEQGSDPTTWYHLVRDRAELLPKMEASWVIGSYALLDKILRNLEEFERDIASGVPIPKGRAANVKVLVDSLLRLIGIWNRKFSAAQRLEVEAVDIHVKQLVGVDPDTDI